MRLRHRQPAQGMRCFQLAIVQAPLVVQRTVLPARANLVLAQISDTGARPKTHGARFALRVSTQANRVPCVLGSAATPR